MIKKEHNIINILVHMYRVSSWDRSPRLLPGDEYEIYFEAG